MIVSTCIQNARSTILVATVDVKFIIIAFKDEFDQTLEVSSGSSPKSFVDVIFKDIFVDPPELPLDKI